MKTQNNIIKINGANGIIHLFTDDTFTLAICDVDSETGEATEINETTPSDLLSALGEDACRKLLLESKDGNEIGKLERALGINE